MAGVKDAVVVDVASSSSVVVEVRVEVRENWDAQSRLSREYKPESMLESFVASTCPFFLLFFRQLLGVAAIVLCVTFIVKVRDSPRGT